MKAADRGQYIAGLRALADLLESNPDLELPTHGEISWLIFSDDEAQLPRARAIMRTVGGKWGKVPMQDLYRLVCYLGGPGGLEVSVTADRAEVCTRVVTGTREVTKVIPVETREVVETEEIVEWVCEPLLAKAVSA